MKKFNSRFKANKTRVKIKGMDGCYVVKEIHESRKFITVAGLGGSFQRRHIELFTNK